MWSLQRILYKRKTRRFVHNMINKYSDIRLSGTTKARARKQRRIEATGARVHKTKQDQDYGDQVERSTSSCCRIESERSLTWSLTMLGWEQSQLKKRHEQQQSQPQPQQDEAHLYHWRMSETQTESDYGSGISSTRLTRLLEEDENEHYSLITSLETSDSCLVAADENQHECSNLSETGSSSPSVESAPTSITNLELSGCPTVSSVVRDSSPSTSPSTTTEALLPKLRPTAPLHCVVPNCCDYFTSPHPHYPKEVIGMAKCEDSSHSVSVINPDTTNEGADNDRDDNERGNNERSDHEGGNQEGGDRSNDSSVSHNNNEFEMWDYVCPQYARRYYANEWF